MKTLLRLINKYIAHHDIMPSVIFLGGEKKKCQVVFDGKYDLDDMGFTIDKYTALHTWYYKWDSESDQTTIVFQK